MSDEDKSTQAQWAIAAILLVALLLAIGGAVWYSIDNAEQGGRDCARVILDGGTADDC